MKPSAALLIDLENFYLSRIDHFKRVQQVDKPTFSADLRNLVRHAAEIAGVPFSVRRAYAEYVSLGVSAQELMRQGIEPVQVFRLSGKTGSKNASDMKLAMDAVALAGSGAQIEHFVLVTGDADFIPVILELKRRGHVVSVVAVTGATNDLIQRFADHFVLYENLPSAEPAKVRVRVPAPVSSPAAATPSGDGDLQKVGEAIRRLLGRTHPLRFGLVHAQLSAELGSRFDPNAFGCDTTGEFLRKNYAALRIVVRGTQNDQVIDLPGVAAPSTNGHGGGTKAPARQAPAKTERQPEPAAPPADPHTAAHYQHLLANGRPNANEARVIVVPWESVVWVCDAVGPALRPPTGSPATSIELMPRIQAAARATGVPNLSTHVAFIYSAVRHSLGVPSSDGVYSLADSVTSEDIRRGLMRQVVFVLACRLSENKVTGPIRPEAVAAMFEPGPALEQVIDEVKAALAAAAAEPAPPAPVPPPVAPARSAPRADTIHNPSGYIKLLKQGGPQGSRDPKQTPVQLSPWPSIERVCADTFAVLAPAEDETESKTMQRGQFLERLYAAEKDGFGDAYRAHVRRAFTLLRLSHAVLEEDDRVRMHPEVSQADDIRWAVLGQTLNLLRDRLKEKGITAPIRPDAIVAALEAGPYTEQLTIDVTRSVENMYQTADETEAEAAEPVSEEEAAREPETAETTETETEPAEQEPAEPESTAGEPSEAEPVYTELTLTETTSVTIATESEPEPATAEEPQPEGAGYASEAWPEPDGYASEPLPAGGGYASESWSDADAVPTQHTPAVEAVPHGTTAAHAEPSSPREDTSNWGTFDSALPEYATTTSAAEAPAHEPPYGSGTLDVAAITSAAVSARDEPPATYPPAEPAGSTDPEPQPALNLDLDRQQYGYAPAPEAEAEAEDMPFSEALPLADEDLPLADYDSDSLYPEPAFGEDLFTNSVPESTPRHATPPPLPAEAHAPATRMTPPPLPPTAVQPPPLPPLPPESA